MTGELGRTSARRTIGAVLAAGLLVAACGGSGTDWPSGVVSDSDTSTDTSADTAVNATADAPGSTAGSGAAATTIAPEPSSDDTSSQVTPAPVGSDADSTDGSDPTVTMGLRDDFDGSTLDQDRWVVVERDSDRSNDERGCYLARNVEVADGALHITTRSDAEGCESIGVDQAYSSGMVQWRTYAFTYGRLEVRAKVSGGRGPWPAIWLLGTDCQPNNPIDANDFACNWPQPGSDEIDVAEFLGGDFTQVNHQIHSGDSQPGCRSSVPTPHDDWHVYAVEWTPDRLVFEVDGVVTCELDEAVPTTAKFLLINQAVGGFGGGEVDPSTLPADLWVDYVAVEPA